MDYLDPRELMAQIREQADAAREPEEKDLQKVVSTLLEIAALREVKHHFEHGQPVIHKYPRSANVRFAEYPAVFIRYLDEPIRVQDKATFTDLDDATSTGLAGVLDAEILFWFPDGEHGRVMPYFADSRLYRPWTPPKATNKPGAI